MCSSQCKFPKMFPGESQEFFGAKFSLQNSDRHFVTNEPNCPNLAVGGRPSKLSWFDFSKLILDIDKSTRPLRKSQSMKWSSKLDHQNSRLFLLIFESSFQIDVPSLLRNCHFTEKLLAFHSFITVVSYYWDPILRQVCPRKWMNS